MLDKKIITGQALPDGAMLSNVLFVILGKSCQLSGFWILIQRLISEHKFRIETDLHCQDPFSDYDIVGFLH